MAETHFSGKILILSVLLYCCCLPSVEQQEMQAVPNVLNPELREQVKEDIKSGNWTKTFELLKRQLDNSSEAYKQVNSVIQNDYDVKIVFKKGYIDLIKVLLDNGLPDIDMKHNPNSYTMLHGAAYYGQYELVNFLIQRGAKVNVKSKDGDTPLHQAARMGYDKVVKLLAESGADIDATDNDNETPLHWAARNGHKKVVLWLVCNGCDTKICNNNRETALDAASSQEIKDIITNPACNSNSSPNFSCSLSLLFLMHIMLLYKKI